MSKVLVLKSSIPQGTLSLISCPIILLNNGAKSTPLMKSPCVTAANPIPVWMVNWLVHCVRAMRR